MYSKRGPAARQRRVRRKRNLGAFLASILLILGAPVWFLFPPREVPAPSSAVLVIAGPSDGRHELGAQMVEEGISQQFVVSNPAGARDEVGSAHCRGKDRPESAVETWCMRSDPKTTAGEAMTMNKLAQAEAWETVNAVTNRPHARRVRTIFERCTDLDVTVVPIAQVDIIRMPVHVAREIAGYIKFWLTNPCRN